MTGAIALLATGTPTASAEPDLATVQRKVESLGVKVSRHTEDYNEARIELRAAKKRVSTVNRRLAGDERTVEKLRGSVVTMASSAYMGGPTDLATIATTQHPQDVVDKAASLDYLSTQQQERIRTYQRAAKSLSTRKANALEALKEQRKIAAKLKRQRDAIQSALAEQKQLLDRLQAAGRASRSDRQPNMDLPPASGRAGAAIAFAQQQIGKPYEWGAEGPDSYDCSGLTMAAWRRGGVSLPHSSRAQYNSGPHVPRSQLAPGDLVFFGNPIHHVGLYVGNSQMIAAPSTGKNVSYKNINNSYYRSEWAGAVRPG